MRFSLAAVLAVASLVAAQRKNPPTDGFAPISKPAKDEKVPAGKTYEIVWEPTADKYPGTVTITLLGGPNQQGLQILDDIEENVDITDGAYEWDVPKTLGDKALYGIELSWDGEAGRETYQWGFPFQIVGGSVDTSTTRNGTSTTSTTAPTISSSSTPSGNLSTTSTGPSQTSVQTTTTTGPSRTSGTTTPTSGAAPFTGSTLALFGGLAMAIFSL